jgi:hypothetical protein
MKDVPLTQQELLFLTDMMMGCPLGLTKQTSLINSVDDVKLFSHLLSYIDDTEHFHD